MIKVEIRGLTSFSRQLKNRREILRSESRDALLRSAESLKSAAKGNFLPDGAQGSDSRRPIRRSGKLADSLSIRETGRISRVLVGTDLEYGRFLEFGTKDMPARPWLSPAVAESRAGFRARLVSALRRTIQGK